MAKYHYIIIGSGPAGCLLARKLARGGKRILLLERGDLVKDDPMLDIPSNSLGLTSLYNKYFLNYGASLPDTEAKLSLPAFFVPVYHGVVAGELVGGGSSVNGMQVVTGTTAQYREWASYLKDLDWSPEEVEKRIKNILNFHKHPESSTDASKYASTAMLNVEESVQSKELAKAFVSATNAVVGRDLPQNYLDLNNEESAFIYWTLSTYKGKRQSAQLFLEPLVQAGNTCDVSDQCTQAGLDNVLIRKATANSAQITLITRCHVSKILLDKDPGSDGEYRATGVAAVVDGKSLTFSASAGVISSAGISTSQILQLSGIGDKDELAKAGVKAKIHNANVGHNMKNHLLIDMVGVDGANSANFPVENPEGIYSGGAFLNSHLDDPRVKDKRVHQIIPIAFGPAVFMASAPLHTVSNGSIVIQTPSPDKMPFYKFDYLKDPLDADLVYESYVYMFDILTKMGLTPIKNNLPAPNPHTDAANARAAALTNIGQTYHWYGTSRMAPSPDLGVVDSGCKVFGTSNLYVCDASVIPIFYDGNTMMAAYIIASVFGRKLLLRDN